MNPNLTTYVMADQIERTRSSGRQHHKVVRTSNRISLRTRFTLALRPLSALVGMIAPRPIGDRPEVAMPVTIAARVGHVPN